MKSSFRSRMRTLLLSLCPLTLLAPTALAGTVTITSPHALSNVSGAVSITASASEITPFHLELWDNGRKLGNVFAPFVNTATILPPGPHILTILAVSNLGKVLDSTSVRYTISVTTTPAPTPTPIPTPTPTPQPSASDSIRISSPAPSSTTINAVTIAASATEGTPFRLEVWDNGYKLGDVFASIVDGVYVLPSGSHVLTVQAIDAHGSILNSSSVNYTVAESCSNSRYTQCNLDQLPVDNVQNNCNPPIELLWVANGCGGGVQGVNPTFPQSTLLQPITEAGTLPDQGNHTLNGHSLHVAEVQSTNPSNVLFRGQSPSKTPPGAIDSHWTLDQYVYLPDPSAHQAFEIDTQYTAGGIWTKFYTECAFNIRSGTGFWGVFDSATGGWIFLNGLPQNGQTPPVVPCNRSQFAQPWTGSSNPSFTGWHHIAWTFLRDPDGTVTYQTLTFDGTTTPINFHPTSSTGGNVSDSGNFSALIQLDGVVNTTGDHNLVDAFVSEINITHTP